MKRISIYLVAFILLSGCGREAKEAKARFDNAKALYERNNLYAAKSEIDSIRLLYPGEIEVLKESLQLMRQIDLKECQRNIAFCDSLLPIKTVEAEKLKQGFSFEKEEQYEEIGNYVWKQQTVERNVERSYIRGGVNEKGQMYLASVFYGNGPLNHTGLKVSNNEGLSAETATIPYDGGKNYRFKDLGMTTEIVTYKGAECEAAAKFIYSNRDGRIKAEYIGGKKFFLYIADGDKKAIAATFELATVLSDIESMKQEKEKATKKIAYITHKLEGTEDEAASPPIK